MWVHDGPPVCSRNGLHMDALRAISIYEIWNRLPFFLCNAKSG